MSWSNYTYKKPEHIERKPGDYRCIILNAESSISKTSGKQMLVITLRPSGTTANVKAYIVDNDYFDDNFSQFLDAFPDIKGNSAMANPDSCFQWRGAEGAIKLKVNDNGYFEPDRYPWIEAGSKKEETLPDFVWKARDDEPQEIPTMQEFTELDDNDDEDGEIPF